MKNKFLAGMILGMVSMAVLLCGIAGGYILSRETLDDIVDDSTQSKANQIYDYINEYYLGDIDEELVEEYLYKGILEGLEDPYSVYYTAEEYQQVLMSQSGSYIGIGVTIYLDDDGQVRIVSVNENGAAYEAGIQEDDVITRINNELITSDNYVEMINQIQQSEGQKITLTLTRGDDGKEWDVTVIPESVDETAVTWEMQDTSKKIGYIKIEKFSLIAVSQFEEALESLQDKGMKVLIVDLRDNPGGLVDVVCDILDELLPEGILVYTEDKEGNRVSEYTSDEDSAGVPVVVLQNENSASASEIFAGAVQDHDAGIIVGTTSYGKGIVQRTIELADGSAVKITTQKYFTPNGSYIHGVGIDPDITVEAEEEEAAEEETASSSSKKKSQKKSKKNSDTEEDETESTGDNQLDTAIDVAEELLTKEIVEYKSELE